MMMPPTDARHWSEITLRGVLVTSLYIPFVERYIALAYPDCARSSRWETAVWYGLVNAAIWLWSPWGGSA